MIKVFVKLEMLIAIWFVFTLLGCSYVSSSRAEQVISDMPSAALVAVTPSSVRAENKRWRFVVFGDTRDSTKDTQTGISPLLGILAKSIAAEKPALVIHTGDLINGYYTSEKSPIQGKYNEMFANWKAKVKPIYDFNSGEGIPLYVVRGNHEDGEIVTNRDLKTAYMKNIAAFMPQTGPKHERGLTYSVKYRQAAFIAIDEYSIKELGLLRGLVDQLWLNKQLVPQDRTPFMFVFGHVPAYKVAVEGKGPFPDLYFFRKHRDAFWGSLKEAGVLMYFCGHVHFYCRVTKDGIQQVLIGNGGANLVDFNPQEVDSTVMLNYPNTAKKASTMKQGYVLFTVDETAETVTAVQKLWNETTRTWETGDTFITQASF